VSTISASSQEYGRTLCLQEKLIFVIGSPWEDIEEQFGWRTMRSTPLHSGLGAGVVSNIAA
jgi:hypothetical protein